MAVTEIVAIVWRVAAIAAVVGMIIGRMNSLRKGGHKKRDGS